MNEELRRDVTQDWVGKKVVVYPLNNKGNTIGEQYGWLESVNDMGIEYRQRF